MTSSTTHRTLRLLIFALSIVAALLLTGCGGSSGGGTKKELESIDVTPKSATIKVGDTVQFTATGTYSDGSTKDLSADMQWSSAFPTAATVDSPGLATCISAYYKSVKVGPIFISASHKASEHGDIGVLGCLE